MALKLATAALISFIALFPWFANAEVYTIASMKEAETKAREVIKSGVKPQSIWMGFDVDLTLIQPDNPAAFFPNMKKHADIYKQIAGGLDEEEKNRVMTTVVTHPPQRLIETNAPTIVKRVSDAGIKTSHLQGV